MTAPTASEMTTPAAMTSGLSKAEPCFDTTRRSLGGGVVETGAGVVEVARIAGVLQSSGQHSNHFWLVLMMRLASLVGSRASPVLGSTKMYRNHKLSEVF